MRYKTLKRLLITFSIAILSYIIAISCADWGWGWFGYSSFAPEPYIDKSYSPLLFEPYEMFYGIGHDDIYTSRFNDEIVNEWQGFLGNLMNKDQTTWFLLNDSSKNEMIDIYQSYTSKTSNPGVKKWGSKIKLQDQKVKEFIEFMYFAKIVETSSVNFYDPWNYEEAAKPSKVDTKVLSQLQNKYQTETGSFLKSRYWFQYSKALFYSENPQTLIAFFDQTKNSLPKNTLYYRVLSYVAGIHYRNKEYSLANYQYSQVFDNCPQLRVVSAYNFHPQEEADWQKSLQLAATPDEKASLWAVLGYYADQQKAINEIFNLNPKNKHLDYLLTRLINHEELNVWQTELKQSISAYKSEIKNKLNPENLKLVNSIALSEKSSKPYLWNMVAGYLQTLNTNYADAKNFFAKAEKQIPNDKIINDQLRLLKLINSIFEMNSMNEINENKILDELKWLYSNAVKKDNSPLRYDAAIEWSKKYISTLYASGHNVVMAELFNSNTVFYHDLDKLVALKEFKSKTGKTPFESFANQIHPITMADIYEYEAIVNTFNNNMEYAFECISKADVLKDQLLPGNPFNGKIQDCHDCDHLATQKTKYSKFRFVEIIKIMQEKLQKGEDFYNNYTLLANAFYNISYYGNARFFYNSKIIDSYDKYYDKMIFDNSKAKEYYQKALEFAANDEQRAKCSYMLAKCQRNEYYNSNPDIENLYGENALPSFLAWDGFVMLKTKYAATKFYKEVINECGYFKSYLNLK